MTEALTRDSSPRVSILIVTRNNPSTIERSVTSCLAQDYPPGAFEVVVRDDASDPDQRQALARVSSTHARAIAAGRLRILQSDSHGGLGEGRNRAAEAGSGQHLFYLDGDAFAPPDWIRATLSLFENERVGVVAPRVVFDSRPDMVNGQGATLTRMADGKDLFCLQPTANADANPRDVLYAMGCGMAVRRRCWTELGGFDPQIVFSHEDAEFCLRAWKCAWRVTTNPAVTIRHDTRSHWTPISNQRRFLLLRNRWYVMLKHWPLPWLAAALAVDVGALAAVPPRGRRIAAFLQSAASLAAVAPVLRQGRRQWLRQGDGAWKSLVLRRYRGLPPLHLDPRHFETGDAMPPAREIDGSDLRFFLPVGAVGQPRSGRVSLVANGSVEFAVAGDSRGLSVEFEPPGCPLSVHARFAGMAGGEHLRTATVDSGIREVAIGIPPGCVRCRLTFVPAAEASVDPVQPDPFVTVRRIRQTG